MAEKESKREKFQRKFREGFTGKKMGLKTQKQKDKERKAREEAYIKSLQ